MFVGKSYIVTAQSPDCTKWAMWRVVSLSVCNSMFSNRWPPCVSTSSLLQDTECWERSAVKVAEITSALIRERSPALVGQFLQAWGKAATTWWLCLSWCKYISSFTEKLNICVSSKIALLKTNIFFTPNPFLTKACSISPCSFSWFKLCLGQTARLKPHERVGWFNLKRPPLIKPAKPKHYNQCWCWIFSANHGYVETWNSGKLGYGLRKIIFGLQITVSWNCAWKMLYLVRPQLQAAHFGAAKTEEFCWFLT